MSLRKALRQVEERSSSQICRFPKIRVFLGGSFKKDYSILGFILGLPSLGNYHFELENCFDYSQLWGALVEGPNMQRTKTGAIIPLNPKP